MLNRNKQDVNSYVNSNDLERYLSHLRFDHSFLFRESELTGTVDDLFRGNNTHAIILINDEHPSGIGHYVCLRKDHVDPRGVEHYTWFDCLAGEVTEKIQRIFVRESRVKMLSKPLMSRTENLCGKYCVAFCNGGNIPVEDFAELLTSSKFSPDRLIANLYRLNYGDNVL